MQESRAVDLHTSLFVFPSALQFGDSLVRCCCNS